MNEKVEEFIGVVKWDECSFIIDFPDKDYEYSEDLDSYVEVIGNYFDNSDLLLGGDT